MPIPSWFEYAAKLPSNIPDTAYNAQRESYWAQFVRPEIVKSGGNEASAYEDFMRSTERPEKSNYPRTQSFVAHALGSTLEPLMGGSTQGKSFIRWMTESSDVEAARQGVGVGLPAFAGEMVGMTPYFSLGVNQAKNLARGIAGRTGGKEAVQAAARMQELGGGPAEMMAAGESALEAETARISRVLSPAAIGTVQAAYDAGRAEPGQKVQAAVTGFGLGAGTAGILENIGPLSRLLTQRHGVSPEDARLLENAALGRIGEEEASQVAKNLIQTPEIENSIVEWSTRQFQMARAVGNPDVGDLIEKGSRLRIKMVGADGKEYNVGGSKGIDPAELNTVVDRVGKHLQKGGKIVSVEGDAEALRKLRGGFDELYKKSGAFDLPVIPRGIVEQAPGEGLILRSDEVKLSELITGKQTLPEKVTPPKKLQADQTTASSSSIDTSVTTPSREVEEVTVSSAPSVVNRAISFSNYDTGKGVIKANFEWKGYFGEVEMPVEGEMGTILVRGQEFEVPFKTKDMAGLKFSINKVLDFVEENKPKVDKISEPASPIDYFEKLPNGMVRDKETGKVFPSMRMAAQSRGVLAGADNPFSDPSVTGLTQGPKFGVPIGERTPAGEASPSNGLVSRPLYDREVRPFTAEEGGIYGYTEPGYPGQKSRITYDAIQLSKTPIVHETFHALAATNDISGWLENFVRSTEMGKKLYNGFSPSMRRLYSDTWGEEVYTYLQQAIRLTDEDLLNNFVKSDDSWENVMNFMSDTTRGLLDKLSEAPDSIYKRALERRLNFVLGRSGTIKELSRPIDVFGDNFYYDGDNFIVETATKRHTFDTRDKLMQFIEDNYSEPTTAPSLPGEAHIPPAIQKFGRAGGPFNPSKTPGGHSPVPTDAALGKPSGGRVRGGWQLFSFWPTPTYSWMNTVAEKNNWPELYSVFGIELKNASAQYGEALAQSAKEILDTGVQKLSQGKRIDLAEYLRTPAAKKAEVAKTLNLTSEDLKMATRLRALYDKGYTDTGVNAPYLQDYVMRFENPDFDINSLKSSSRYTKEDIDFVADHTRSQELDMKNRDVLENLWTYYRLGLRKKYMGEPIKKAAEIVNMKNESGEFVLGSLQPYFKRHVELIKGNPDFTNRIVKGVVEDAVGTLNDWLTKANAHLPSSMQLGKIEAPDDVLRKWITFSFAGTMGLRPIVPIRDSLQLFLTTYPLLGEKYLGVGMAKAFPAIKGGIKSEAWEIAQKYGALMHENPMHNLASGTDSMATGKMEKVAETMLKPLLISNNSNRLVSFWGHSAKTYDALINFAQHGDPKKFMKESSGWALDSLMQKGFVQELTTLAPEKYADFAYRMAKELVDVSQWNYQRGAAPGLYKYTLGRLFGQYGTWPMNYWNYAKRLLTQGEPSDRVLAGTRLLLAHGAVLSTMQNAGIDAGQWVFTQPMAYSGGPLTSAMLALPSSLDFESVKGVDARKELSRYPFLNIPGGMQMQKLYNAVINDDEDMFAVVMGFKPLSKNEANEGYHALVP